MSSPQGSTAASSTDNGPRPRQSNDMNRKRIATSCPIVRRDALRGAINSGLRYQRVLGRAVHFVPGLAHRRVCVEAHRNCTSSSLLYVPQREGITEAQIKKVRPNAKNVVRRGDEFFISFIGMSIASFDNGAGFSRHRSDNELLLYSMQCLTRTQELEPVAPARDVVQEPEREIEPPQDQDQGAPIPDMGPSGEDPPGGGGAETIGVAQQAAQNARVDTGYAATFASDDHVYIHYDPVIDGRNSGTMADQFVTIPATKRIYTCSDLLPLAGDEGGDEDRDENNRESPCLESLFMRFTVMEIDKISDLQARAVIGVDHLGSFVSSSAGSIPYIQLLTKAFAVASSAGKHGLKRYSRPDHVLSVNKEFILANPEREGEVQERAGREAKEENYLRYGYYYFLSRPVPEKLYAVTNNADEHIPLMMKRTDINQRRGRRGCKYIPLTEDQNNRGEGHKLRLENMLSMSTAIEVLAEAERNRSSRLPRL
ncbi:hypothetical protein FGB62_107g06 [Gracilaria domingensis]|nr:hypothetical protein FGB62_107g06 [Gracilaria domingensis]